jgi:hypothetical protein
MRTRSLAAWHSELRQMATKLLLNKRLVLTRAAMRLRRRHNADVSPLEQFP